jgi:hypothetical protein
LKSASFFCADAGFAFVMIVNCCVFGMTRLHVRGSTALNAACCGQFWS